VKTIQVMYVATNETYYALRSRCSEHLREALRAGVPRQLKAHNFYILTETVRRRLQPLVGVRVEDTQVSGDALAVQIQLTTSHPSRVYAQRVEQGVYVFSFPAGEKPSEKIRRAFAKQVHTDTQDGLISAVHSIVRGLPGVHIKGSGLSKARNTELSALEAFDLFVEG
jgi:hypothetical protein